MKIFIIRAWIRKGQQRRQMMWAAGTPDGEGPDFQTRKGQVFEEEMERIRQHLKEGWELDPERTVIVT